MRVITWNMRRATETSAAWKILADLNPDVALLQEVSSIPKNIKELFDIKFHKAIGKTGKPQQFGTAIFVKGKIIDELSLSSEYDWVKRELEYFAGNLVSCTVHPTGYSILNIVSVYSPAWPIDISKYPGIDITTIKLKQNPRVWVTEILWSALKNANLVDIPWIVGGDFNSSETFDLTFSSGNREILDRMESLGFTECLRKYNDTLTPTFRNPSDGKVIHQIDHLFVTGSLYSILKNCTTGDKSIVFGESASDHLPIIANFKDIYSLPLPKFKDMEIKIKEANWTKTNYVAPHEYVVCEKYPKLFHLLKEKIEKEGYDKEFRYFEHRKMVRYYDYEGHTYWITGNCLNRKVKTNN